MPSHLLFKWLLLREAATSKEDKDHVPAPAKFGPAVIERAADHLKAFAATNRGAFMLVSLLNSADAKVKDTAAAALRPLLTEPAVESAGYKVLIEQLRAVFPAKTPTKSKESKVAPATATKSSSKAPGSAVKPSTAKKAAK